ncbi:MAG TPA: FAD-binding oxidoreductase [Holophagaceae bacterium]|nr:FAD-binding oxidoreductase [Holophagaceae bacterium]
MISRRTFLAATGVAAGWSQETGKPRPKPEGVMVNDLHSQLNSTRVLGILEPDSADAVRSVLKLARTEGRPICMAGGRHAMGGQQFATDGVLIDTRKLEKVLRFDAERGRIEIESGLQWTQLYDYLRSTQRGNKKQWTFAQKPIGADLLTMGGCLSANIHGRGLALPPFIGDVESFKLIDASGDMHLCSRHDNPELFRLAIGGYGLFGFIYSITLRLVPRRKVRRVVESRSLDGLVDAFGERIREGCLYGDFQCAVDSRSEDFLRRGVLACDRPLPDNSPMTSGPKALTEAEQVERMELAHSDPGATFQRMLNDQHARSGQVMWSDEQQMTPYPEGYHREIERRLLAPRGSETIGEFTCERAALEPFMNDLRQYALREKVEIIGGSVRLIERDDESFLAWARKPYACISLNLHIEHSTRGLIRAGDWYRRMIDISLRHGGSWYLTYRRHALRRQVEAAYPQFADFLRLKRKYDPGEIFQSDWYRHYKSMFSQ